MNKRGFFLFFFTVIVIYLFITAYFELIVYPKGLDTDYASVGQKGFSLLEADVELQAQKYFIEQSAEIVLVETINSLLGSCGFSCKSLQVCSINEQSFVTEFQTLFSKKFNERLKLLGLEDRYNIQVSLNTFVTLEITSKKPLTKGIAFFDYRLHHHFILPSSLDYTYLEETVLKLQQHPSCENLPNCEISNTIITLKAFFKHPLSNSDFVCPITLPSLFK